jgi:hypothetical protein
VEVGLVDGFDETGVEGVEWVSVDVTSGLAEGEGFFAGRGFELEADFFDVRLMAGHTVGLDGGMVEVEEGGSTFGLV